MDWYCLNRAEEEEQIIALQLFDVTCFLYYYVRMYVPPHSYSHCVNEECYDLKD